MRAARQARGERRGQHCAQEPEQDAQPLAAQRPMPEQPIAPHSDRQQEADRAQPQKLHHQVGGDRARAAEKIVHRRVGRVAERRIVDGPGGERERRHHGETDQRDAPRLAQPPLENRAELAGEKGHSIEAAVDHRHRACLYLVVARTVSDEAAQSRCQRPLDCFAVGSQSRPLRVRDIVILLTRAPRRGGAAPRP